MLVKKLVKDGEKGLRGWLDFPLERRKVWGMVNANCFCYQSAFS